MIQRSMSKYLIVEGLLLLNRVIEIISSVVLHSNNKYISDFAIFVYL